MRLNGFRICAVFAISYNTCAGYIFSFLCEIFTCEENEMCVVNAISIEHTHLLDKINVSVVELMKTINSVNLNVTFILMHALRHSFLHVQAAIVASAAAFSFLPCCRPLPSHFVCRVSRTIAAVRCIETVHGNSSSVITE